ncbi:hypothetical protein BC833DRAFT_342202 [Globomyces pollinis-pini]|nr:hypothetical protein BC833DRAFT_342202 [Globomyces pollinis-pini]
MILQEYNDQETVEPSVHRFIVNYFFNANKSKKPAYEERGECHVTETISQHQTDQLLNSIKIVDKDASVKLSVELSVVTAFVVDYYDLWFRYKVAETTNRFFIQFNSPSDRQICILILQRLNVAVITVPKDTGTNSQMPQTLCESNSVMQTPLLNTNPRIYDSQPTETFGDGTYVQLICLGYNDLSSIDVATSGIFNSQMQQSNITLSQPLASTQLSTKSSKDVNKSQPCISQVCDKRKTNGVLEYFVELQNSSSNGKVWLPYSNSWASADQELAVQYEEGLHNNQLSSLHSTAIPSWVFDIDQMTDEELMVLSENVVQSVQFRSIRNDLNK